MSSLEGAGDFGRTCGAVWGAVDRRGVLAQLNGRDLVQVRSVNQKIELSNVSKALFHFAFGVASN